MSSTFSLANQKLKQFFGANQTKDYQLFKHQQDFQKIKQKIQIFANTLKQLYNILLEIPIILDKLHLSFTEIDSQYTYYDCIEFRNILSQIMKNINNKGQQEQQLYRTFKTQIQFEEQAIKQQQKTYNNVRQKYDHYKTKLQALNKEYKQLLQTNPQSNSKLKTAKQTLDRNINKLKHAEKDYKNQLNKLKQRLKKFHNDFKILSFANYQHTVKNLCLLSNKIQKPFKQIEIFIQKKSLNNKKTPLTDFDNVFQKIPLQKYFHSIKVDNFKDFQNVFMQTEKNLKSPNNLQIHHITPSINNNITAKSPNIVSQPFTIQSFELQNKSNNKKISDIQNKSTNKKNENMKEKVEIVDLLNL